MTQKFRVFDVKMEKILEMENHQQVFPKILIFVGRGRYHHDPAWVGLGFVQ